MRVSLIGTKYKMETKPEDPAITRLKKRIDGNREERRRYEKMYEDLADRVREIGDAKERLMTAFWCDTCEADFNGIGYKVVVKQPAKLPIAWYVGYCPELHKCVKRITEKVNDKYYLKSYIVRRDRARYADDLLTPDDHKFWLLYGHLHGFDAYKELPTADSKPAHTY